MIDRVFVRACMLLLTLIATSASAADNLVRNGGFEERQGDWLADWSYSTLASIQTEGENPYLQFAGPATSTQSITLDPQWKRLLVMTKMRVKGLQTGELGYQTARLTVLFLGEHGEITGYGNSPSVVSDTDWVTLIAFNDVPPKSRTVSLQPGLMGKAGEVAFDDLRLYANPTDEQVRDIARSAGESQDAAAPSGSVLASAAQATQLSATRGELVLDGLWRFSPSGGAVPEKGWGYIRVPGSWMDPRDIIVRGTSADWMMMDPRAQAAAWYETRITVPADWEGRSILLDVGRISTDATVYIDGKEVGSVNWPEGTVNLTDALRPGQRATLRLYVVAVTTEKERVMMMGMLPGQSYTIKANLASAGLTGTVKLLSRPKDAHVSNVFIRTSTRNEELRLDTELNGIGRDGEVELIAEVLDEQGTIEQRFIHKANVKAGERQVVSPAWKWTNPRLWDVGQPNLYTLRLSVRGAGIDDQVTERFGFREFWIDGRNYYLNGTIFRARPDLGGGVDSGPDAARIAKAFAKGFNLIELWPGDLYERGALDHGRMSYDTADATGMPITGVTPHMGWRASNITSPEKLAAYRKAVEQTLRRDRNHPSIVMWGTSGNMMGGEMDPGLVGQRQAAAKARLQRGANEVAEPAERADQGLATYREFDPTRPVFIHHGGNSGDVYTLNNYLNFIPLQEREEWLSTYVKRGDMPLWYVEFGTPHTVTYTRGRNGYGPAQETEIQMTEYAAAYLGNEAFRLERPEYRQEIANKFLVDQRYSTWHANKTVGFAPAQLKIQELFSRNTLRSWRTMGMTGGYIGWEDGYAELDGKETIAGKAIRENNGPTLAWICGPAEAFTDKAHNFAVGTEVRKQVAVLNDTRAPQEYHVQWRAEVNGREVASDQLSGRVEVAKDVFVPVTFKVPAEIAGATAAGRIVMDATIGGTKHTDEFTFRVFAKPDNVKRVPVVAYDPVSKSTAMLRALGYEVRDWDGRAALNAGELLVIGREALTAEPLPPAVRQHVVAGGRLLILAQQPQVLKDNYGFRVSGLTSRQVFKVAGGHPVTEGLDDADLRNWAGTGTMLEPYPDYANDPRFAKDRTESTRLPYYGWRWGNRHTVTSGAIEKPHRSGWRPILESEFGLSYSPLMELDYGAGRILFCQLDVEDQAGSDPAAARLARQLLDYAADAPLVPRAKRVDYVGGNAGAALLDAVGVTYERAAQITRDADVVVLGADAAIDDAALQHYLNEGGYALVLPRAAERGPLGVRYALNEKFDGSLDVPQWREARGLSASDIRRRSAAPAWLLTEGAEVGAAGLLGRKKIGKGAILFCQNDPHLLDADRRTYLRRTRWHATRTLAQMLANLGASFSADDQLFAPKPVARTASIISLAVPWRAKQTQALPSAASFGEGHVDPGLTEGTKALLMPDVDDASWDQVTLPMPMESVPTWEDKDGEAVFRARFDTPAEMLGKALVLNLGTIDDNDDTFVNGVRVGGRGEGEEANYAVPRQYALPADLLKPTGNVVAVRVWDRFGGGAFTGKASQLYIGLPPPAVKAKSIGLYHADYRDDFELGDDPYRYWNW